MTTATLNATSLRSRLGRWLAGGLAVAFGLVTIVEGGSVLFGDPAARAGAGNIVPFVLMFNFGAGFVYVLGGFAALLQRRWAVWIARAVAISTLLVFAAFGIHVLFGGAYELRTLAAMTLRSGFWVAQALVLPRWCR
jgi:hypothetical protein